MLLAQPSHAVHRQEDRLAPRRTGRHWLSAPRRCNRRALARRRARRTCRRGSTGRGTSSNDPTAGSRRRPVRAIGVAGRQLRDRADRNWRGAIVRDEISGEAMSLLLATDRSKIGERQDDRRVVEAGPLSFGDGGSERADQGVLVLLGRGRAGPPHAGAVEPGQGFQPATSGVRPAVAEQRPIDGADPGPDVLLARPDVEDGRRGDPEGGEAGRDLFRRRLLAIDPDRWNVLQPLANPVDVDRGARGARIGRPQTAGPSASSPTDRTSPAASSGASSLIRPADCGACSRETGPSGPPLRPAQPSRHRAIRWARYRAHHGASRRSSPRTTPAPPHPGDPSCRVDRRIGWFRGCLARSIRGLVLARGSGRDREPRAVDAPA